MHKYQVYPGNYSELIKEALDKRENWREVQFALNNPNSRTMMTNI
jgi:hypothetical protein